MLSRGQGNSSSQNRRDICPVGSIAFASAEERRVTDITQVSVNKIPCGHRISHKHRAMSCHELLP